MQQIWIRFYVISQAMPSWLLHNPTGSVTCKHGDTEYIFHGTSSLSFCFTPISKATWNKSLVRDMLSSSIRRSKRNSCVELCSEQFNMDPQFPSFLCSPLQGCEGLRGGQGSPQGDSAALLPCANTKTVSPPQYKL